MDRRALWIIGRAAAACGVLAAGAAAQPEWAAEEAPVLTGAVQLTDRAAFASAGEQYFSPDGSWIIFQGKPARADGLVDQHYSMYVARLRRGAGGAIEGIETPILVSAPGSANTCGWFHPKRPGEILFGSTIGPIENDADQPQHRRTGSDYFWKFPEQMELVRLVVPRVYEDVTGRGIDGAAGWSGVPEPVFERPAYDAEGSWSPDGRFLLYAHVDPERTAELGRPDADLYVFDSETGGQAPLVAQAGYDGGPFFSPDMSWICYRSDRQGDGNLQLFVAELEYGAGGAITGIRREVQITDNSYVNWAPYFHPSGRFLVYTTSELGHQNYEVYAIEFDPDRPMNELWRRRITHAEGFDGLPVFSRDGEWMIWCGQRGELGEGDARPTSQVWAARFDVEALLARVGRGGSF